MIPAKRVETLFKIHLRSVVVFAAKALPALQIDPFLCLCSTVSTFGIVHCFVLSCHISRNMSRSFYSIFDMEWMMLGNVLTVQTGVKPTQPTKFQRTSHHPSLIHQFCGTSMSLANCAKGSRPATLSGTCNVGRTIPGERSGWWMTITVINSRFRILFGRARDVSFGRVVFKIVLWSFSMSL